MALRVTKRSSFASVVSRAVLLAVAGCSVTGCFPLERTASNTGPAEVGSQPVQALPGDQAADRKAFVLQYSADLKTCEQGARAPTQAAVAHDLASIRRALAENTSSDTIVVRRGNVSGNEDVKNCLVRLGYVVSH